MYKTEAVEIIHKHIKDYCESEEKNKGAYMTKDEIAKDETFAVVFKAMDEYAKLLAIDFAVYATDKAWFNEDSLLWELHDEDSDPFRYSGEELYNKFLKEETLNEEC
jgi:hypothetical protein